MADGGISRGKLFVVAWLTLTAFDHNAALAAEPADPAGPAPLLSTSPLQPFERAVQLFFAGDSAESARVFDDLMRARPDLAPGLWQRGLALYYAGRYDDGRKQFELHRTVNPNDVENPAWHFLCVARMTSPEQAREQMLPVGADARVPMREILGLYRGEGTAAAVLAAAVQGADRDRRNQLCYAHLYLGLYAEVSGDETSARDHILKAAGPFAMDHYMGRVAKLHARLRGWGPAADEPEVDAIDAPRTTTTVGGE
jgi:lipoprotein NlpI